MSARRTARAVLPAALLAAVVTLTTACATTQAGSAIVAATASSVSVSVSAPASTTDLPSTTTGGDATPLSDLPATAGSETSDAPDTIEPTEPTEPTKPTEPSEPTGPAHPSSFDQVTGVWLDTMCTDVHTYLGVVAAVPSVSVKDGPEEYRQAWLDFLGANAYQMDNMVGNMSQLDPPNLPNGPKVHQAYVDYFTNLKDATVSGWELIDSAAADPDTIEDIVGKGVKMMQAATESDMGLGNLVGAEYKSAMEQIDSCAPLLQG
jgi:hypothetical protein